MRVKTRAGRLACIKPMEKLFDFKHSFFCFYFCTWCKTSGCTLSMSQSLGFSLVFSLQKRDEGCNFPHSLIGRAPDALLKETKHKLCFKRGSICSGHFDQVYRPTCYFHLTLQVSCDGLIHHWCMAEYVCVRVCV